MNQTLPPRPSHVQHVRRLAGAARVFPPGVLGAIAVLTLLACNLLQNTAVATPRPVGVTENARTPLPATEGVATSLLTTPVPGPAGLHVLGPVEAPVTVEEWGDFQ
jgi:hypothetical protein